LCSSATFGSFCFAEPEVYEKISGYLYGNNCLSYVTTTWEKGESNAAVSVYFGDCHGKYEQVVKAPKANCHGCGGMKGNPEGPVGNLQINDGVLWLTFWGGSRNEFTDIYKWRYDKKIKDFLLIGRTYKSRDIHGEIPLCIADLNYSTSKMEVTNGKKKKKSSFKTQQVKLSSFVYEDMMPPDGCK
jgi:hypothetical protein